MPFCVNKIWCHVNSAVGKFIESWKKLVQMFLSVPECVGSTKFKGHTEYVHMCTYVWINRAWSQFRPTADV